MVSLLLKKGKKRGKSLEAILSLRKMSSKGKMTIGEDRKEGGVVYLHFLRLHFLWLTTWYTIGIVSEKLYDTWCYLH